MRQVQFNDVAVPAPAAPSSPKWLAVDHPNNADYRVIRSGQERESKGTQGPRLRVTQIDSQALRTLSISVSAESDSVHVVCDAQKVKPSGSHGGHSEQEWVLDEAASNLFQYIKAPESEDAALELAPREFRAELAAFSSDGRLLRVGSQLYSLEESGDYVKFRTTDLPSDAQRRVKYIEELAGRDTIVAVASRRAVITLKKKKKPKSEDDDSDSDGESDTPSVAPEDEAYESWSECSTAEDDGLKSDSGSSDVDFSEDESSSGSDGDEDEDEPDEDSEPEVVEGDDSSDSDSQSEESDADDPATYGYATFTAYDSDDDAPMQPSRRNRRRRRPARVDFPLSLDIFSSSKHVFHFSQQTFSLLHDSPPVVHPTLPLVVWPLDGSEALFADCHTKSYFMHMFGDDDDDDDIVPSIVKCHFSACGKYLHLALVRGVFVNEYKDDVYLLRTQFTAEVLTYRLCTKKPTRSPPTLLYRVRAELGSLDDVATSPPPCTFTWAPRELYITASGGGLTVHRIALFGAEASVPGGQAPAAPSPESIPPALSPDFLFFPGRDNVGARLVVGSESVPKLV